MIRLLAATLAVFIFVSSLGLTVNAESEYERVYCKSREATKKIALTFDDGPHPRFTKEILDILSEYGIKATFFVIGVNANNYPESLKMIQESGCEIGNHTYSHKRMEGMGEDEIRLEIEKCDAAIFEITGIHPKVFRPPQGYVPNELLSITAEKKYKVALWSIDTLDWSLNPAAKIYSTVSQGVKGGDIILMHDYVSGGNTTCDALRMLIPSLLERGYSFVTLSELLG